MSEPRPEGRPPPDAAGSVLRKISGTPTPAVRLAAGGRSLPPDLLRDASKRLGWVSLIYAVTFTLAYFGPHYLLYGSDVVPRERLFGPERALQTTVALVSIGVGLSVFVLSRLARIRPERLLDIGLVFEVVGAFGISMSVIWGIYPQWPVSFEDRFVGIPWECVWIVVFPVLAPNTPGKTLVASLAAASTGLSTLMLSMTVGPTSPDLPLGFFAVSYLFTTYLCAGIAFAVSLIVYRVGWRLKRAREIGSYQLIRRLGEGGMGEVWLGRHRMLARPAAIKLIRPETLGRDDTTRATVVRRFQREARATAALRSKHTIELYDFGVSEDGSFYYVMELLDGLNLEDLVTRYGPQPPGRVAHLLRQACHSLGEAHAAGLVHRDIKPANIYTCRLGPDLDFVKILDFGLVKATGTLSTAAAELTAEGVATGTPAFMAPELALGRPDIDGRADIYGLGCVGYWLLTGEKVFEADSPLATLVAHVNEPPIPPSQRSELPVPEALESLILACLEKDPADRPQTTADLARRIDAVPNLDDWAAESAAEWWGLHEPAVSAEGGSDEDYYSATPQPLQLRRAEF